MSWLLPAGAALLTGQHPAGAPRDLIHYDAPTSLQLSDYAAQSAPISTNDRFRIARGRTATLVRDTGGFSLALNASRARSAHEVDGRIDRRDAFATYQVGAATRADLPAGLTLGAGGSWTLMTRRLGPLDFDGRPRHSFILVGDVSIARGPADRLSLSYVDVAPASSRTMLARMAELIGDSPEAGRGLRFMFTHRVEQIRHGSLTMQIEASATRLTQQDSLLLGAAGRTQDRKLALTIDRRF